MSKIQQVNASHEVIIRTAYGGPYPFPQAFNAEDRTKQAFKDECDINVIMRRYQSTGELEHVREAMPQYLDVSGLDFQEAQQFVASATSLFYELPSAVRLQFENDPAKLLEFVHDPKNAKEAVAMGFLDPEKVPPGWGGLNMPQPAPAPSGAVPGASSEGGQGGGSPPGTPAKPAGT